MTIRRCTECDSPMIEGYVIDDGSEFYCKDECLHKNHTQEEYLRMYNEHGSYEGEYTYWTEWSPLAYVCKNKNCEEIQEDSDTCEQCGSDMREVDAMELGAAA